MPELYPLIKQTAKYYWSKNSTSGDILKDFMAKHAPKFVGAPSTISDGEMNLEYYSLFEEYLKLYEENLLNYIEKLDASVNEFYQELATVKDDKNIKDKKLLHFVNYLLACTDYGSFYKVMVRAAKKLEQGENDEDEVDNDAKAESKTTNSSSPPKSPSNESKSESKTYGEEKTSHK